MTHIGQKLTLGPAGRLRLLFCLGQLRNCQLTFRDVADDIDDALNFPIVHNEFRTDLNEHGLAIFVPEFKFNKLGDCARPNRLAKQSDQLRNVAGANDCKAKEILADALLGLKADNTFNGCIYIK